MLCGWSDDFETLFDCVITYTVNVDERSKDILCWDALSCWYGWSGTCGFRRLNKAWIRFIVGKKGTLYDRWWAWTRYAVMAICLLWVWWVERQCLSQLLERGDGGGLRCGSEVVFVACLESLDDVFFRGWWIMLSQNIKHTEITFSGRDVRWRLVVPFCRCDDVSHVVVTRIWWQHPSTELIMILFPLRDRNSDDSGWGGCFTWRCYKRLFALTKSIIIWMYQLWCRWGWDGFVIIMGDVGSCRCDRVRWRRGYRCLYWGWGWR